MNDQLIIRSVLAVFAVLIVLFLVFIVSVKIRLDRLEAADPMHARLRKSIRSRVIRATSGDQRRELADPSSGKILEVTAPPKGIVMRLLLSEHTEVRMFELRPCYGIGAAQIDTVEYRFPLFGVKVCRIAFTEDELTTRVERREMRRQAWRTPDYATVNELIELEMALAHWRPVSVS